MGVDDENSDIWLLGLDAFWILVGFTISAFTRVRQSLPACEARRIIFPFTTE